MKNDNKEFEAWLKGAAEDSGNKIASSSLFAGIVTKNFLNNPLCALQIGYAVLMDKPIVLIVDKDATIPALLTRVAKVIERVDLENPEDMARAHESISKLAEEIKV